MIVTRLGRGFTQVPNHQLAVKRRSPLMTLAPEAADRISPHVRRISVVVIVGAVMSLLDMTIVNVALDTLSRDLHSSLADIQWVVTGYMLALAAVIPVTGWAAEKVGARRLWIASVILFTLGSALCGLAWSTASLIVFRVLQGFGGGMIMPIGQMVLARAAGPQRMGRVMSVIGVPMILAPVFGPTIGGLLVDHLGWRWIFYVNVPIGILGVALALRLLPAVRREEVPSFDKLGFALLATGVPLLVYGLAEVGQQGGFDHPAVIAPILASLVLIALFVPHALRATAPLLDVRLYLNRAFAAASLTTFALGAGLFGGMIILPLYFQLVRGEDAVHTGLLLIPQGVGAAIAMPLAGRAADRVGGGRVAVAGLLATLVATLPFALIGADTSYWLIGAAMIARGLGIGMTMMPAMTAAYAALTPGDIANATPQLSVIQRVGGSIGTAVLTVVLQNGIAHRLVAAAPGASRAAIAPAFSHTYWVLFAVTAAALAPALLLARVESRLRARAVPRSTAEPVVA
jgi:EmrB/QacA subfamily drug resistance transporter